MKEVDNCSEIDSLETSVPSGMAGFVTISGPILTQEQIGLLSQRSNVNALFFMGVLKYRDPNMGQTGIEFCGFYSSDPQSFVLCKKT